MNGIDEEMGCVGSYNIKYKYVFFYNVFFFYNLFLIIFYGFLMN